MRKIGLLFFLLFSATSMHAGVRASVNVPADGYYYDGYGYPYWGYDNYWYGPGWYWGIYFDNEASYWGYRRGWGHGPNHWHGHDGRRYRDGRYGGGYRRDRGGRH